jgi:tetratricopeptide (TPR) repeat protein
MIRLWTLGTASVTDSAGNPLDAVAAQSKRLAVLAYLTLATPRGWHRRDTILAMFWPELDQARARHALRQTLHFLRRHLGAGVIRTRGSEDIAAGPDLWCDAAVFEAGDPESRILYRGDLLPGFFIRDAAPEFDHWLDQRRDALRARATAIRPAVDAPRESVLRPRLPPPPSPPPVARHHLPLRWLTLGAAAAGIAALWIAPPRAMARPALADSLYHRGLTTLQDRVDSRAALGWFEAALQASPRFALAAYYAGVSADGVDGATADRWFARAEALAPRASDHDRLVIESGLAFRRDDPAAVPIAESLATRYPADPVARHLLAASLLWSGDFGSALREFHRERDLTESLRGDDGHGCRSCDAIEGMAVSLQFLDSLGAAEQVARQGVERAPRSGGAWTTLAIIEAAEGHVADARAAGRRAGEVQPGQPGDPFGAADLSIRAGDFDAADRTLRDALTFGTSAGRHNALWLLVISLRNQGRLGEALALARAYRHGSPDPAGLDAVPVAQVLFEDGRTREAAALFDSVAVPPREGRAAAYGNSARRQVWALAHAAEAWASVGDTARVKAYADTIAQLSVRSLYGRDRHLPDHLRGLIWLARGHADSALAHLTAAVFSPTIGYTRTNLALGRTLLTDGHPRAAATIATAGLAEAVDGSAYYATRTELHELAAQAFDASGERDSAVVHYTQVVRAWGRADPMFASRCAAARARLITLQRGEQHGLD